MGKPSILISIETKAKTESKIFGRHFMQCLIDENPRLVPELVSTSERFKEQFIDLDNFVDEWWAMPIKTYVDDRFAGERFGGPLWKRKSALASRGVINHGLIDVRGRHIPSKLWFESRWDERVHFSNLFDKWIKLSKPSIGMLHLFTDIERALFRSENESWFETGSFGGPVKPGIPNIGWAMAYGEGYTSEVDADRISAAGYTVDKIDGAVVVRVTPNLSDVVNDFAFFARRRSELKRLFRPGLFWVEDEPALA